MRLAFFLVLALVAIGLARGDFASGEARSEAVPLFSLERDSLAADTTRAPEERGAEASGDASYSRPLTRLRIRLAPEAD